MRVLMTPGRQNKNGRPQSGISRRQFVRSAGLAAGSVAVFGATSGVARPASAADGVGGFLCGIDYGLSSYTTPLAISGMVSGSQTYSSGFSVAAGTTLIFDPNVSTTMHVSANVIIEGTLVMRPANDAVVHTLEFENVDENAFIGGGVEPLDTDVGLWVLGDGVLDLVGAKRAGWNRTGTDPTWKATDEIRRTPIDHESWDSFPEFALGDVPPKYRSDLPAAEVFNLTRNVIIKGTPTGRAHTFIRTNGPQTIKYVQFDNMGPRHVDTSVPENNGVLGRYGLHFHFMLNSSFGSVVEGCVATDCGYFGFVPHASYGITIKDCVAYNCQDGGFWWDLGDASDYTVLDHCLAAGVPTLDETQAGNNDNYWRAGFVFGRGTGNRLIDSAACGVMGLFSAAGFLWPRENNESPNAWAEVRDIVSHNNRMNGFTNYQRSDELQFVSEIVAYNNQQYGFFQGLWENPQINTDVLLVNNGGLVQGTQPSGGGCPFPRPLRHPRCANHLRERGDLGEPGLALVCGPSRATRDRVC